MNSRSMRFNDFATLIYFCRHRPKKDLIDAIVAMKGRNPSWGCPRIAQQIALAFGLEIDKDVVRRLLSIHYRGWSGAVLDVLPGHSRAQSA